MRADAYINCRMTSETKAILRKMAEREEITESTLVKQLLGAMLALNGRPMPVIRSGDSVSPRSRRRSHSSLRGGSCRHRPRLRRYTPSAMRSRATLRSSINACTSRLASLPDGAPSMLTELKGESRAYASPKERGWPRGSGIFHNVTSVSYGV